MQPKMIATLFFIATAVAPISLMAQNGTMPSTMTGTMATGMELPISTPTPSNPTGQTIPYTQPFETEYNQRGAGPGKPFLQSGAVASQVPGFQENPSQTQPETGPDTPFPDTTPYETASEQGFGRVDDDLKNQQAAREAAFNTSRQKGIKEKQPAPLNPVAIYPHMKNWLMAWKGLLINHGVREEKVDFEAHRLDKDAFAAWASRQMMVGGKEVKVIEMNHEEE